MRVINNKQPGREAAVVPPVEKQIHDPAHNPLPEYETTCTNCLSQFAFRRTDEGVTMTNENEVVLDCPVCGITLEINEVTGIPRQKR